jgi:outer membrane protein OmpA-like peptidoglycan-associated protein
MLCAFLRQKAIPARVRCGFARYFEPGRNADHWLCEHWRDDEGRWAVADAQLDDADRAHLRIGFDTLDLPEDQFVFAADAWRRCRAGRAAADTFGHGSAAGTWFVRVNLVRNLLALGKREVSEWDTWRAAPAEGAGTSMPRRPPGATRWRGVVRRRSAPLRGTLAAAELGWAASPVLADSGIGHSDPNLFFRSISVYQISQEPTMSSVRILAALFLAAMTSACLGRLSNNPDQHTGGAHLLSNACLSPMTHQYTIFFELDSARLGPAAKKTISKILSDALALKKGHLDDVTISVIGYADRAGSNSHNLALSQKRAEARATHWWRQEFRRSQLQSVALASMRVVLPCQRPMECQHRRTVALR